MTEETNGKIEAHELLPIPETAADIVAAPTDVVEEIIEVPEWGYSVKVRSFTGAQSSRIRERSMVPGPGGVNLSWSEMEKAQFIEAVIQPEFSTREVEALYRKSGAGFRRVLNWIEQKSNLDQEVRAEARSEFQGHDE